MNFFLGRLLFLVRQVTSARRRFAFAIAQIYNWTELVMGVIAGQSCSLPASFSWGEAAIFVDETG